jgi:amino acid transporter
MVAIVNTLFAYGGSPGFVSIMAEMRNPADYNKAMLSAQGISTGVYVLVSVSLLLNLASVPY